jgi:hypothetical protein
VQKTNFAHPTTKTSRLLSHSNWGNIIIKKGKRQSKKAKITKKKMQKKRLSGNQGNRKWISGGQGIRNYHPLRSLRSLSGCHPKEMIKDE